MKYRQHDLEYQHPGGAYERFTCWLESGRAKVGDGVTLKDDPGGYPWRIWTVRKVYSIEIDHDELKSPHVFGSIMGRSSKD